MRNCNGRDHLKTSRSVRRRWMALSHLLYFPPAPWMLRTLCEARELFLLLVFRYTLDMSFLQRKRSPEQEQSLWSHYVSHQATDRLMILLRFLLVVVGLYASGNPRCLEFIVQMSHFPSKPMRNYFRHVVAIEGNAG